MKFAQWNSLRTKFKQLKDSPSGKIKGGHADALAALIYFHRNIIKSKNPYPLNYGNLHGSSVHTPSQAMMKEDNPMKSWMKSTFKKLKE
jgi:hypothetical protein